MIDITVMLNLSCISSNVLNVLEHDKEYVKVIQVTIICVHV